MWMMSPRISAAEERELISAVFAAALVILAIFLAFFGVLAAVQSQVEKISDLREAFVVPVRASMLGVILSGSVAAIALLYLSGHRIDPRWIIFPVYLLIIVVIVATLSLAQTIGL
jgi:hypothetical protein